MSLGQSDWSEAERRAVEIIEAARRIEAKLTVEQVNALIKRPKPEPPSRGQSA
jgi:hypothetical protein